MTVEAHFVPPLGIEAQISARIAAAATRIWICMYGFTSPLLSIALVNAQGRGVDVKMVIDPSETSARRPAVQNLRTGGVTLFADDEHRDMHNKFAVIDTNIVITGSYNWTTSAENSNAENIVIITDPAIAAAYEAEFLIHKGHSLQFL